MCGHVGIFKTGFQGSGLSVYELNLFEQMLLCDMVRGKDGTGVARIGNKKEVQISKRPINSLDFIDSKSFNMCERIPHMTQALIGHNRKSTIGASVYANTHPFMSGHITLAHNGTVNNRHDLTNETIDHIGTDSETIALAIEKEGPDNIIPLLQGAFALVWYDQDKHEICFIRNDERELYFTLLDDNGVLYGSEVGLIQWLAYRNKVKHGPVFSVSSGVLYTFDLDLEDTAYTKRNIPLYEPPPVKIVTYNQQNNYGNGRVYPNNYTSIGTLTHLGNRPRTELRTDASGQKCSGITPRELRGLNKEQIKQYALNEYDLKVAQLLDVYAWNFELYPNSTEYGVVIASMLDEPFLTVVIRGIKAEDYEEGGYYTTSVYKIELDMETHDWYSAEVIGKGFTKTDKENKEDKEDKKDKGDSTEKKSEEKDTNLVVVKKKENEESGKSPSPESTGVETPNFKERNIVSFTKKVLHGLGMGQEYEEDEEDGEDGEIIRIPLGPIKYISCSYSVF